MMRSLRISVLPALLACTLAVAACSPAATDDPETTPSSPVAPVTSDARVVPVPDALDPTLAQGATLVSETASTPDGNHSVSSLEFPTAPSVTERLATVVSTQTAAYERAATESTGAGESTDGNELNIGWEVATASGPIIGVRLLSYRHAPGSANGESQTQTVYGSMATGESWASADLFSEPGLEAAVPLLVGALRDAGLLGDAAEPDEDSTPAGPALVSDVVVGGDGSVVVVVNQGELAARADGRIAVQIDAAAAEPLLSDAGRAVRDEITSGTAFVGVPAAEPAPAPTTDPAPAAPDSPAAPRVDCATVSCVALTFDDGPSQHTVSILDALDAAGARATFFQVGKNVAANPGVTAEVARRGHELAGHSWDHRDLTRLSAAEIEQDSRATRDAITAAAGVTPTLMRPPYGAVDDTVLGAVGDAAILWSVDTEDWKNRDVGVTTERALAGAAPGAIILFHDIRETTKQAVPGIVAELQARGYHLVTVSELLSGTDVQPGQKYSQRR